jgi:hypothetical protein
MLFHAQRSGAGGLVADRTRDATPYTGTPPVCFLKALWLGIWEPLAPAF